MKNTCPTCGTKMICPGCVGSKGGKIMTPRKLKHLRSIAHLGGRPRKYPKCKLYRAHRFSRTGRCRCGYKRRRQLQKPHR